MSSIDKVDVMNLDIISHIIRSLWDKLSLKYKEIMVPVPEHFITNTLDCYNRFSSVKCLARKKEVFQLKHVYIPLTLIHSSRDLAYRVNQYNRDFFDSHQRILIVDTAGMGKSTLVKKLYLDIVDNGFGVPIFIELRRLSKDHSIIDEVIKQVSFFKAGFSKELLYAFIQDGSFIFILDGYDEISISDKTIVTDNLQDFITHASDNRFIITSRQELELASFVGFESFSILPLNKQEAFELIRKYNDDNKELSEVLISQLEASHDYDEFLGNPLLTSMLFTAYSSKNEIPRQKHIFYRNVYEAYFNSHDLTKGGAYQHEKHCGLNIEQFHKILRFIGSLSLKKGRIEYTKDDLIYTIGLAVRLCPEITCSAGDYFTDLVVTVPLFIEDGIYFRWAHKSIFEYFVAQNIYNDIKDKGRVLVELAAANRIEKYINILDLYYEIDYSSFQQFIIKPLFERFIKFMEQPQCQTIDMIRRRQCEFSCDDYCVLYIPGRKKKRKGRMTDDINFAFSETHKTLNCHSQILVHNTDHTLFLVRANNKNYNELLISLLYLKNHTCVLGYKELAKESISFSVSEGLIPEKVYRLKEDLSQITTGELFNNITHLMEHSAHLDYERVKESLELIENEIAEADEFSNNFFS